MSEHMIVGLPFTGMDTHVHTDAKVESEREREREGG